MLRILFTLAVLVWQITALASPTVIAPDTVTEVVLSNHSQNRIVCTDGVIQDVVFSEEKPATSERQGPNAWVKFKIRQMSGRRHYVTEKAEFHVLCNDKVYSLIGVPKDVPVQVVRLGDQGNQRIRQNVQRYKGLAHEEVLIAMLIQRLRNEPVKGGVSEPHQGAIPLFEDLVIERRDWIRVPGMGITIKEYAVVSKKEMRLSDDMFVREELADNYIAMALHPKVLAKDQMARLLIVEGGN